MSDSKELRYVVMCSLNWNYTPITIKVPVLIELDVALAAKLVKQKVSLIDEMGQCDKSCKLCRVTSFSCDMQSLYSHDSVLPWYSKTDLVCPQDCLEH